MKLAVLWIGHGTRDAEGLLEIQQFTNASQCVVMKGLRQVYQREALFCRCFIELQAPGIYEAIDSLVEHGATHVCCVPLLLFSAGHLQVDIPHAVNRALVKHRGISVHVMNAVGVDRDFIRTASERLHASGYSREEGANQSVVLVGRGNQDKTAQDALQKIGRDLSHLVGAPDMYTSFLAGSGMSLETALHACVSERWTDGSRKVFVVPYLWFHGWLMKTLPDRVMSWQKQTGFPGSLVVTRHLGPDPRLVQRIGTAVLATLGSWLTSKIGAARHTRH